MDITMYNLICNSVLSVVLPIIVSILSLYASITKDEFRSEFSSFIALGLSIVTLGTWIHLFAITLPDALLKVGYIVKS